MCTTSERNEEDNDNNNNDSCSRNFKVADLIKENTDLLVQYNELTVKLDDLNKLKTLRDLKM